MKDRLLHCIRGGLWLLLLLGATANAGWQEALPDARLVGSGEFSWFGFKVYRARLWSTLTPLAADRPFALELTYRRNLSRDDLVQASLDEIKRLSGASISPGQLEAWQRQMELSFVDVTPGRTLTGVRLPGRGVQFFVDQRLQHEVDDEAFAQAFFAIWLDPRTRNPHLREQLLGP
ncbi:chalcone isomerase family protein [Pseudomonas sp. PH1b]|uniref:chalcone isomerase family protein n=1 Tax=Pseudomonas sp. PH1b TaxID=1397282 RepID=UPI0004684A45|nr:chalcone isomerase family protein [Pseudomonas sp. PH1b]